MAPDANHTLDSRRVARDQETRVATSFNVFRPYILFNASMLQVWSDVLATVARNSERTLEVFGGVMNEQKQESQQHY